MVHFLGRLWYNWRAGTLDFPMFSPGRPAEIGRISVRIMVHFCDWREKKLGRSKRAVIYPYDILASCPDKPLVMPYQRSKLLARYWPIRVAARKWGCTYRAARLYMLRHPDLCVLVRIRSASAEKPRWIITVPAGTPKIPAMRGNPDMMDPEWQRRHAIARWHRRRLGIDKRQPV